MITNGIEWLVLGGFLLIEAAYLPQIARLHRRKEAEAISVFFPTINLLGRILVAAHTIEVGAVTMTAGFLLGILLRATLVGQVLLYRHRSRARAAAQS